MKLGLSFGIKNGVGAVFVNKEVNRALTHVEVEVNLQQDVSEKWYNGEGLIIICGEHIRYFDKVLEQWVKTTQVSELQHFDEVIFAKDLLVRADRKL